MGVVGVVGVLQALGVLEVVFGVGQRVRGWCREGGHGRRAREGGLGVVVARTAAG